MSSRRSVTLAVALIFGGLLYSAWVAEFFLKTGLDPTRSFLSELDANDQPYREFFSYADTITGISLAVASILGLMIYERRRYNIIGWVSIFVFAASTIADSRAPIACVAADDPTCPIVPIGFLPQLHEIHALTSSIAVFAIFSAMVAFTIASFKYHRSPLLRTFGVSVLVLTSATTVWMLIADNLSGDWGLGIAQRIQVGGMSAYLVVLGLSVLSKKLVTTNRPKSVRGERIPA